jgi:Leucine-rich repeat (LRR) protein
MRCWPAPSRSICVASSNLMPLFNRYVWRRMPGLTGLDLQGTRITDAGVESLARLAQLTTLSLARTAISDKAVLALARLKRLERLDLSDTQVTPDALDRLRTLLPKCRINDE